MKKIKKIFVIYNPYDNGYYDGEGFFRGILFCKKYEQKENAILDIEKILNNSNGKTYLKIESLHTY